MTPGRIWSDLLPSKDPSAADRPTVVLVHGSMDRGSSFRRTQRHLADLNTLVYDRRGYAHSLSTGPARHLDDQVADLLAVVAPLGDRPVVVVGHSYGGVIALRAAASHPDRFAAIATWEAPTPWADWWHGSGHYSDSEDPADSAEAFMSRMVGPERWRRLPSATREARRKEGPTFVAEIRAMSEARHGFDVAAVAVPLVSGAGSEGSERHQRGAREVAEAAPRGEFVSIEGSGHGAHLTHPAKFADVVVRRAVQRATEAGG